MRFNNPLWHDVDQLATYIQSAFEHVESLRRDYPARQHARAQKNVSTGAAFLIIFTTGCAFMCVACVEPRSCCLLLAVCCLLLLWVWAQWFAHMRLAPLPPVPCLAISYYPLYTRSLNMSIKGNRALLLLLPPDVMESVKVGV
jgi:hypothetical protein